MNKVKLVVGLVVAVAVCAGILILAKFILKQPETTEGEEIVVINPVTVDFKVAYFKQGEEGQLAPWDGASRGVDDAVVPYVTSDQVIAVTLLHKTAAGQYEMIADAEWTKRGQDYYFSSEGAAVTVTLKEQPEDYCVLGAVDMPVMGLIIQKLPVVDIEARNARLECFSL